MDPIINRHTNHPLFIVDVLVFIRLDFIRTWLRVARKARTIYAPDILIEGYAKPILLLISVFHKNNLSFFKAPGRSFYKIIPLSKPPAAQQFKIYFILYKKSGSIRIGVS